MRFGLKCGVALSVVFSIAVSAGTAWADHRVIVKAKRPYTQAREQIARAGGTVIYEFRNADGLVVTIPDDKVDALNRLSAIEYFVQDPVVPNPRPVAAMTVASMAPHAHPSEALPLDYSPLGNQLTNAVALHGEGIVGRNVIVAVIDSGVSSTASVLAGRVLGGESFVPGATEPGPNSPLNDPHGTWVSSVIGANGAFLVARTSALATAIRNNCPESRCTFPLDADFDVLPLVGQAPEARFYALKVFPASGGGAPQSRILAAMDRAIDLKETTLPDLRIVNMSLGGTTLFAAHDLEDELGKQMAAKGITLVTSSGNTGPSGSTVGSPGTARNILTVGAASDAIHERIVAETFFGVPGSIWRPDAQQQMADFSSRGPNADGRIDPELVANGVWTLAQGAGGGLSFVSGTSFAAPVVSGVSALLYESKPTAKPSEIRTALILGADRRRVPAASVHDQGAGYIDAAGANAWLTGFPHLIALPDRGPETRSVSLNVLLGAGVIPIHHSTFKTHLGNLRPSERKEFYFKVGATTALVRVKLSNIVPELPPEQQNQVFGDDLQFAVHSAKTSSIGATGDYLTDPPGEPPPGPVFVNEDTTFEFPRPESGLIRVTVLGDWTNAGRISTDLSIEEVHARPPRADFRGTVTEGQTRVHTVTIPAGAASVSFGLSWDSDWGAYPTNDIDLILTDPSGVAHFEGATLDSPELVTIATPAAGTWTIAVNGFTVFGKSDRYRVTVDYDSAPPTTSP